MPDRLAMVRKKSLWVSVLAGVLVAVLTVGAIAGLMVKPASNKGPYTFETPVRVPAGITYTAHAPILINGNSGFLGLNNTTGISWGSGAPSNPYIIEGWDINASAATGIFIENSNAYFIVRDCHIYGNGSQVGIRLSYCVNGVLTGNNCSGDSEGIHLDYSSDDVLSNNICSSAQYGIDMSTSGNDILINNTCNSNAWNGVSFSYSSSNTMINNTCSKNLFAGIYISQSNGIVLSKNNCTNNDYGLTLYASSSDAIAWNRICNNTGWGIAILDSGSGSNNIWYNTFIGNNGAGITYNSGHVQAYDIGMNNHWNTSGSPHGYGNYWSDLTKPDANHDGIVDWSYNLTGGVGAKDYYPQTVLTLPISEFGMMPLVVIGLMAVIVVGRETRLKKKSHI